MSASSKPYVLASINGFVRDASFSSQYSNPWTTVNGSWVVSIRSTGRAGFSANVYRTDASLAYMTDGWHGPLILHYVAWDYFKEEQQGTAKKGPRGRFAGERGREGEVGILFGSFDLPAVHPPPPGAPWVTPAGPLSDERFFEKITPHNQPWSRSEDIQGVSYSGAGAGGGGAGAGEEAGGDLESEMAAYGGGQPEVVKVPFGTVFGEAPRVLVSARITCPYDRQAVVALTVRSVDTQGFELNVLRVDHSWALQALAVEYIAWIPSYDMVTAPDMLNQAYTHTHTHTHTHTARTHTHTHPNLHIHICTHIYIPGHTHLQRHRDHDGFPASSKHVPCTRGWALCPVLPPSPMGSGSRPLRPPPRSVWRAHPAAPGTDVCVCVLTYIFIEILKRTLHRRLCVGNTIGC
jgi:hypothetical protein